MLRRVSACAQYPSFQRARVVRDKKSFKTKGYGFVSFSDATDYMKAMKEMQGACQPLQLVRGRSLSRAARRQVHWQPARQVAQEPLAGSRGRLMAPRPMPMPMPLQPVQPVLIYTWESASELSLAHSLGLYHTYYTDARTHTTRQYLLLQPRRSCRRG